MPSAVLERSKPTLSDAVRRYWDSHIHDLAIAKHPVGTPGFFDDLERYRFEKLDYLPKRVDFSGYRGKRVLEVGCGLGLDLARFAEGGARVTGIDLSQKAIELARAHFEQKGLKGDLRVMDGEKMSFSDKSFDVVYAHGVLPYAPNPERMVREIRRVLRPGGKAILMSYNTASWFTVLSRLGGIAPEHADAPVFRTLTPGAFRRLAHPFSRVEIIGERFPVATRLHSGWKAAVYNTAFVAPFRLVPQTLIQPFGWHLLAFAER